jgi:hypothetical protein
MVQILLIAFGAFILLKGSIKLSETRRITRPSSICLGLIVMIYGITLGFIPVGLIWTALFYGSLFAIFTFFIVRGEKIESREAITKANTTKRNLFILLAFIALIVTIFYLFFR